MVEQDRMQQLDAMVNEILERNKFESFARYWSLYKRTVVPQEAEASYIVYDSDACWCNVAIIHDNKIVDIEGEDGSDVGSLSVTDASRISGVTFRIGPLVGFSRSQGASLVVVTEIVGSTSGRFWVARTPDEEERLVQFTRYMIDLISDSRILEAKQWEPR